MPHVDRGKRKKVNGGSVAMALEDPVADIFHGGEVDGVSGVDGYSSSVVEEGVVGRECWASSSTDD